jgi:hypothetical protein
MLKFRIPEIFLGAFLAVAIFAMGMLFASSLTPRVQNAGPQQTPEHQTANKINTDSDKAQSLWVPTDSVGLYTLVLAVFTGLLVAVSTGQGYFLLRADKTARIAANAAVTQANAIIGAERPYVFFKITKPGLLFAQNAIIIPDPDTNGRLHFELINAGRTPAMLEEVKGNYTVIEGITDAPAPLDPMKDRGRLLPVGTISTVNSPFSQATNLFDEENAPEIRKMMSPNVWESRRIFCHGYIRYADAFGNHYITGFLAAFSPRHGAWALRGGKQYNYSRQENLEDIPPHPGYPGEE